MVSVRLETQMGRKWRSGHPVGTTTIRSIPSIMSAAILLLGGLATFFVALTYDTIDFHLAFFAVSVGLVSVGLFALTLRGLLRTPNEVASSVFEHLIKNEDTIAVLTDTNGAIRESNSAFKVLEASGLGKTLQSRLATIADNPDALVFRILNGVMSEGHARESVIAPDGRIWLLTARHCAANNIIWCVDEVPHAPDPDNAGLEQIVTPILRINSFGDVVWSNMAARNLMSSGIANIKELFGNVPIADGAVVPIVTQPGTQVRLVRHLVDDGLTELFLLPFDREEITNAGFEQVIDALPVALAQIDADGIVKLANAEAMRLVQRDDMVGQPIAEMMEGLGRSMRKRIADMLNGRGHMRSEVARVTVDGHEIYLQVTLKRLKHEGEASLLAVISDATELKTLEAQFVQSQKMQAVGQLAGGVAHDFNNLLTAINGHCDLLLMRHHQGDTDYGDLIQVRQNANRAASLVGQLLAFSRKQTLLPKVLDIYDTLTELSQLLNRLLGEKVTLTMDHGDDLHAVRVDKRQLEQVIMNLVVNARDAMPNGGEVSIITRNIHLEQDMTRDRAVVPFGDYVKIDVIDSGTGIPQDTIQKIFEPFYTTKKTGEGTGLGLSTVYGIIKQTGGFIFAESTVGQGSTFTIILPIHQGRAAEARTDLIEHAEEGDREPVDHTGRGVVLLVEDEVPVRSFAARALNLRGYTVIEAESAEEALDILSDQSLHVDVFVSDVVMPGMDGPTWVKKAQENRPDTKVVFVSGYTEDAFGEGGMDIPNSSFLPKPFSLNDLTEMVKEQVVQ